MSRPNYDLRNLEKEARARENFARYFASIFQPEVLVQIIAGCTIKQLFNILEVALTKENGVITVDNKIVFY